SLSIEAPSRLAVGFRRIPPDLPIETSKVGDRFDQVSDGYLVAGAEVDRLRTVVSFCGENDSFGRIIGIEELPRSGPGTPDIEDTMPADTGIDAFLDQRRDNV